LKAPEVKKQEQEDKVGAAQEQGQKAAKQAPGE